jgi:hypothetical protein
MYCANLGLKINAKLGGRNVEINGSGPDAGLPVIGGRRFMLIGERLCPSACQPAFHRRPPPHAHS